MTDRPIFSTSPLFIPVISLMAGMVYGRLENGFSFDRLQLLPLVIPILFFGFFSAGKGRNIQLLAVTAVVFFIAGAVHIHKTGFPDDPAHIYNLIKEPEEITIAATVRAVSTDNRNHGRILVTLHEILKKDGSQTRTRGLLQLKTDFPPSPVFEPGKKILARASVFRIGKNGTPGTFDYRRYMADRNIYASGRIRSPAAMSLLESDAFSENLATRIGHFFLRTRHRVAGFVRGADLDETAKGLFSAILIGQRAGLSERVVEDFRRSGAFHLLAISGMHMFLLFLLSTCLIKLLLQQSVSIMIRFPVWKLSAAFALVPLLYYTAISGANPPAVRACVMTTVMIIAILADRKGSVFNALCLAALIILILDPTALFSPSFQLSFAAVSGMIIFNNSFSLVPEQGTIRQAGFDRLLQWVRSSLIISLVAFVVTSPLTLYYFQQTSFVGPVSTLLAAPAICFFSLPMGLLASLIYPVFPTAAGFFLQVGAQGLIFSEKIISILASIPHVWMRHSPPTIFQIGSFYLFLFVLLKVTRSPKSWLIPGAVLLVAFLAPFIADNFSANDDGQGMEISFIDVGQGNATLVQFPDGGNILIDGGAMNSRESNVGENIIIPFFRYKNIRKLDALIITHAHSDHYNGLGEVIDFFKPEKIWVNGSSTEDPAYNKLLSRAVQYGASITAPADGDYLIRSGEGALRCFQNRNLHLDDNASENSRSLVIEIRGYGKTVFLPGDLMKGDGVAMLQGKDCRADILYAPHHGSETSATTEMVRLLKPQFLIVASGLSWKAKKDDAEYFRRSNGDRGQRYLISKSGTISCSISSDGLACEASSDKGRDDQPS